MLQYINNYSLIFGIYMKTAKLILRLPLGVSRGNTIENINLDLTKFSGVIILS